jgi:hypothetical protein
MMTLQVMSLLLCIFGRLSGLSIKDYYKFVPKNFHIIGFDGAGTVLEAGPECANLKPGDDVFYVSSTTRQGSAAEYVLVDERLCAEKPKSLDFVEAASMGLTFGTAYQSLVDRLEIKRNETVGILIVSFTHALHQSYSSYCYLVSFHTSDCSRSMAVVELEVLPSKLPGKCCNFPW